MEEELRELIDDLEQRLSLLEFSQQEISEKQDEDLDGVIDDDLRDDDIEYEQEDETITEFPYRFKKTYDDGGVVQVASLDVEELPMMTYRDSTLYWDDVGLAAGGAITISGSGTTRYYQLIDLTLTGASAVSWVEDASNYWATIMALHDDTYEVIPVLTVRYESSVIQWWVQHQWGTIRMPSNA